MLKSSVVAAVAVAVFGVSAAVAQATPQPGQQERRGQMGQLMQADANGDGRVTKDEIRARRSQAFDRRDANKDGFVSADEAPQREARRTGGGDNAGFMRADADGDGKVSRAEFVDRDFGGFDRIDANKDGAVDRSEIAAAREQRRTKTGG